MGICRRKTRGGKEPVCGDPRFLGKWRSAGPDGRHILVVDEFGNTGPSRKHETKFGFGVSDVRHPGIYAGLSRFHRRLHRTGEQKAGRTSKFGRTAMAVAIRLTGTKTSCVYVDKNGKMPDWMNRAPYRRFREMLDRTLDETLPEDGVTWVVIDHNNQYRGNAAVEKICRSKSNGRRTVYGSQYESDGTGLPSDLIQTNDHVANAARANVELGKRFRSKILGTGFRQLGGGSKRRRPRVVGRRRPGSRLDRRRPRVVGRRRPGSRLDL